MSITQERKAELIKEFGKNEKDSGSASVQVAILSERIRNLTEHLKDHKRILDHAVVFWPWLVSAVVCLITSRQAILQPTKT